MTAETIENTVKGMLQAHGDKAADEARLMVDRMVRRKDSRGEQYWRHVFLALRPEKPVGATGVQPEARSTL